MGLDIVAYENITYVEPANIDEYGEGLDAEGEYLDQIHGYSSFPERADGLEVGKYFEAKDVYSFRAGSYSGYNFWRSELAKFAGYNSDIDFWENATNDTIFNELINFSDCEGLIGPKTSARLYQDFQINYEQARIFVSECNYFMENYEEFMKAFQMASNNGFVRFC